MSKIIIESYQEHFKAQIIELILKIQHDEFNVAISIEDQPDLQAIEKFYNNGNGNFWVAIEDHKIVGTIALFDIKNNQVALRKMFVQKEYRGNPYQVGQMLLNTAFEWAAAKQLKKILLGTTEKFLAAQRFYEKNGFVEIDKKALPIEFPVMKVDVKFYEYLL